MDKNVKGQFITGNKAGVGNMGSPLLKSNRKLTIEVRNLLLTEIKKGLEGDDVKYKRELILKLGSTAFPRIIEGAGDDGELIVNVINYGNTNPIQLPTSPISAPGSTGNPEKEGNNLAQESGEEFDNP